MNTPGEGEPDDLLVRTRSALLDVLEGLVDHREAVVVIGAQAVHLRTGGVDVALAETTKDSDVALDPRMLAEDPRVEAAMQSAGFFPSVNGQPGAWVNAEGVPVDLMVPESLAGAAHLDALFASGAASLGSTMAGRAEEGVGDPTYVAAAVSILAADLYAAVTRANPG